VWCAARAAPWRAALQLAAAVGPAQAPSALGQAGSQLPAHHTTHLQASQQQRKSVDIYAAWQLGNGCCWPLVLCTSVCLALTVLHAALSQAEKQSAPSANLFCC
jgi:hypothetical protein